MLKVNPVPDYPVEEGHYLRGNDFSPVAVVVILTYDYDKIPKDIEHLVRLGAESGAALSGTLQTENIGLEKLVCNIIANPNIRYIVLCGPESRGHLTGDALMCLVRNGIDDRKRIIGTDAPTPYLFNLPKEYIERFRKQIAAVVNLLHASPESVSEAIRACYQENSTQFQSYHLYDRGAYPEPPISGKLTWRVTHPEREPKDEEERKQVEKFKTRIEWMRKKIEEKRQKRNGECGKENQL
ncbi:MAG: tetrahydromethanopterin S-methyltransferase subunit A [Spirochaetota bacterium]